MTKGVTIGSAAITGVYVGGNLATGLYVGSTKIWPAAASPSGVTMLQAVAGINQSPALSGTSNTKPYSVVIGLIAAPGNDASAGVGGVAPVPKLFDNGSSGATIAACGKAIGTAGTLVFISDGLPPNFPIAGLQLSGVNSVSLAPGSSPSSQSVTCPTGGYVVHILAYQTGAKVTATAGTGQTILADFYDSSSRIGFHIRGAAQSTTFTSGFTADNSGAVGLVFA